MRYRKHVSEIERMRRKKNFYYWMEGIITHNFWLSWVSDFPQKMCLMVFRMRNNEEEIMLEKKNWIPERIKREEKEERREERRNWKERQHTTCWSIRCDVEGTNCDILFPSFCSCRTWSPLSCSMFKVNVRSFQPIIKVATGWKISLLVQNLVGTESCWFCYQRRCVCDLIWMRGDEENSWRVKEKEMTLTTKLKLIRWLEKDTQDTSKCLTARGEKIFVTLTLSRVDRDKHLALGLNVSLKKRLESVQHFRFWRCEWRDVTCTHSLLSHTSNW